MSTCAFCCLCLDIQREIYEKYATYVQRFKISISKFKEKKISEGMTNYLTGIWSDIEITGI